MLCHHNYCLKVPDLPSLSHSWWSKLGQSETSMIYCFESKIYIYPSYIVLKAFLCVLDFCCTKAVVWIQSTPCSPAIAWNRSLKQLASASWCARFTMTCTELCQPFSCLSNSKDNQWCHSWCLTACTIEFNEPYVENVSALECHIVLRSHLQVVSYRDASSASLSLLAYTPVCPYLTPPAEWTVLCPFSSWGRKADAETGRRRREERSVVCLGRSICIDRMGESQYLSITSLPLVGAKGIAMKCYERGSWLYY